MESGALKDMRFGSDSPARLSPIRNDDRVYFLVTWHPVFSVKPDSKESDERYQADLGRITTQCHDSYY